MRKGHARCEPTGVAADVGDDEEVRAEPHGADDRHLGLEAVDDVCGDRVAVAHDQPLADLLPQPRLLGLALGDVWEARHLVDVVEDFVVGLEALGDQQGVVLDEPLRLFTGPAHPFASAPSVRLADLAGHRVWMPGNAPGTEWAAYYDALAEAFGLSIDAIGPDFGVEALLDTIVDSATLATFLSERTPLVWPVGHDLRLVPLRDPTPIYPHSLLWRADNPHPALATLRDHLVSARPDEPDTGIWKPQWAR
ncbi:hypothetical protein FH965_38865 [Streptomyces spectabilis]|uniref:LysR substrate-binding domain-containing protein n=1 Tax=Streptomyces spectabilis TaxID=68270 RepID=A0A516RJI3_STRST|nr:hypothetical protein FH965_38865 [Streptomyces spectabilis]